MTHRTVPPPLDLLLARRDWVRRFARTLARDDAAADDLAQDAWLTAVERTPQHAERPAGWLRRVLTRRAMDVSRAERRRIAHESAAARPEASRDVADVVAAAEMHRRVVEAVVALDEPFRTTVLLRWFEDLPPREVAARMGVPVETVRARARRAVERLRSQLDAEQGGRRAAWLVPLLGGGDGGAADGGSLARGGSEIRGTWIAAGAAALVVAGGVAWSLGLAGRGRSQVHTPVAGALDDGTGGGAGRLPRQRAPASGEDDGRGTGADGTSTANGASGDASNAAATVPAVRDFVVTVVDPTGAPLAGVRVKLDPAEMDDEPVAATGADGVARFRVTGPVRSAKLEPEGADGRAWRFRSGGERLARDADRCTITADASAWNRGVVRRQDGSPFGGAEVIAVADGFRVARTDAAEDGSFALPVPESGRFDVVPTGAHAPWWTARRQNTPEGRITGLCCYWGSVDGEARGVAAATDGVEIVARPQMVRDTTAMRIRVVGDDGTPVAGVPVHVDRGLVFDDPPREPSVTDAKGRAVVQDVPVRRVTPKVETWRVDGRPWETAGWALPPTWRFVRPDDGEVTLVLPRGVAIRGRAEVPAEAVRRKLQHPLAQRVSVYVRGGAADGPQIAHAIADSADAFEFLIPADAAANGVTVTASLAAEECVQWTASADGVRAGGAPVVLRLGRVDPPAFAGFAPKLLAPAAK